MYWQKSNLSHYPFSSIVVVLFSPFMFTCATDIFVFMAVRLSQHFLYRSWFWCILYLFISLSMATGMNPWWIFKLLERLQAPSLLDHDNWQPVQYSNESESDDKCLEYSQYRLSLLTSFTCINDIWIWPLSRIIKNNNRIIGS